MPETVDVQTNNSELHRFETGAVRSSDVDHMRFDLISPIGLRRLAERYALGAKKYTDHNFRKGMQFSNLVNHIWAHLNDYLAGNTEDDNLAAIAWGAFALMEFEETRPELNDLYFHHRP